MKKNDSNTAKGKASKVIKPKQFNQPGRKLPKKPAVTGDNEFFGNPELVDPGIDPKEVITPEDMDEIALIEAGKQLSPKEQKLIDTFMQYPNLPKHQLVALAGYSTSSKKAACAIFAQVMVKLDSARHHKEIFRSLGFGEVQIALRLKELAFQNSNLTVALNATVQGSRCLDMQKGEVDVGEGFSVTVRRADEPGKKADTGPQRKHAAQAKKGEITR
jgi:hypothetical protein